MYATTTMLAALAGAYTDTGTVLTTVIATVLAGLIALLGLGFGVRHLRKYITGRKF